MVVIAENKAFSMVGAVASESEVREFELEQVKRWGVNGVYELVGRHEPTNENCGKFLGHLGCLHVEDHHNTLAGNFEGLIYDRLAHHSCNNFRCRVCYKYGAASREAKNIELRLAEASKRLSGLGENGVIEHVILSAPLSDYSLSPKAMRAKALKVLKARGIVGGALVPHAFRYHSFREYQRLDTSDGSLGWFFSYHCHILGFVKGGYSSCRNCRKVKDSVHGKPCEEVCHGCSGFEAKTREQNKVDGYICKIEPARKSVRGTAFYELGHASIEVNSVRAHPVYWFGCASYRKMKFIPEKYKDVCPLCGRELERLRYAGSMKFQTDMNAWDFHRHLYLPLYEGGEQVWFLKGDSGFG